MRSPWNGWLPEAGKKVTALTFIFSHLIISIKINSMFVDLDRKALNTCIRFLHLGLQIVAAYWAVVIDGYNCQEDFIRNITYFAYALIGFNLLLALFFGYRANENKFLFYLPILVNLGLCAGILYFTIEGYNKYNSCAPTRVLYELFFIETIISLVLFIMVMVAKVSWADRYAHWPGNLAWPILFLKYGFSGAFHIPAIVIGVVYAFISIASFLVNTYLYNSLDLNNNRLLQSQWTLSMILMFGCEILAIVMLVTNSNDGEYWWQYGRKIFVVFAAVNIVDFFFWFYGYRRLSAYGSSIV